MASYACQLVSAELQLCGVNSEGTPAFSFASCVAAQLGLAPADASRVIPRSINDTTAAACGIAGSNSSCCCDAASVVQFDVAAVDVAQADAYAAAMPQALTAPAMLQCLQVCNTVAVKVICAAFMHSHYIVNMYFVAGMH